VWEGGEGAGGRGQKAGVCTCLVACRRRLGRHREAFDDCSRAIDLDADFSKAYLRRAAVSVELGCPWARGLAFHACASLLHRRPASRWASWRRWRRRCGTTKSPRRRWTAIGGFWQGNLRWLHWAMQRLARSSWAQRGLPLRLHFPYAPARSELGREIDAGLRKAKALLKAARRKDYYKVSTVSATCRHRSATRATAAPGCDRRPPISLPLSPLSACVVVRSWRFPRTPATTTCARRTAAWRCVTTPIRTRRGARRRRRKRRSCSRCAHGRAPQESQPPARGSYPHPPPAVGCGTRFAQEIGEAYNILSDATKRRQYDAGATFNSSGGGR